MKEYNFIEDIEADKEKFAHWCYTDERFHSEPFVYERLDGQLVWAEDGEFFFQYEINFCPMCGYKGRKTCLQVDKWCDDYSKR